MPFFLVGRSRDDLSLTLLSTEVFDTRDLAARAVQSVALSGGINVDTVDVYIADLGAAAPVVLVGMPVTAPASDDAAAGVWETPETDIGEDISADAAIEEVAAAVDSLGADDALTAALERATSSMAAEGIVPPESVGFAVLPEDDVAPMPPILGDDEPLSESAPTQEPEESNPIPESQEAAPAAIADDLSAVIASLSYTEEPSGVEQAPAEAEEAVVAEEAVSDDGTWPWMNVDAVEVAAVTEPAYELPTEPASLSAPEPEPEVIIESEPEVVVEPQPVLLADDSLIANQSAGEDPFSPQPVIMGDYADAPLAPEAPTTVYEPAGDLSLADYTCADCIYSNTCPKVNESTPAECGSFQWKAL